MPRTHKAGRDQSGRAWSPAEAGAPPEALGDLDTQLMLQLREGNSEAADVLVRRNFAHVSRYLARVVRNARLVEDLTQEVFLQVLSHASEYKPTAKFTTWLYRIATNTALNYLNQAYVRRRAPGAIDGQGEVVDRGAGGPERRMSLDELKRQVSQAISDLPLNQRVALVLLEYEDLSYQQIAAAMDLTVEAVRCLLLRARATLRRKLIGLM